MKESSKKNPNRNKRNRKYCENRHGKNNKPKIHFGPIISDREESGREQIPLTDNEIQPKNRHCLRELDGKYGRWDEILRDILNGKLKIVQNRKKTETDTEEEDNEDDEEMPETT